MFRDVKVISEKCVEQHYIVLGDLVFKYLKTHRNLFQDQRSEC